MTGYLCRRCPIYVCLTRDHSARLEEKDGPFMSPGLDLTVPCHPAVMDQFNKRAEGAQLRIADQTTRFAGSMQFVYLRIALSTVWMLFIGVYGQGHERGRAVPRR